jgi:hypothetical protein
MTSPELRAALDPVLAALRALGVRHYVGGSIASSAHGVARAGIDADVVAELHAEHQAGLVAALRGAYYVAEARVPDAIARRSSFIHLETMIKVDVFVSKDRPFDRRALERVRLEPSVPPDVPPLPLASAEDTVLAKLEWFRHGGETSERQWTDVLGVLRAGRAALDAGYMRSGAIELGVGDLLERALRESAD